jgi:predicted glycosyltransferase
MKILIDIGHPAHVHLFKVFAHTMQKRNSTILFTARDKEHETRLLAYERFDFVSFGRHRSSLGGKLSGLITFTLKMLSVARKFKPDLLISHGSIYSAWTACLIHKPHIALEDSANMEQVRLYRPFTRIILTPEALPQNLGKKQVRYPGYHELAYLHPDFYTPSDRILQVLNLSKDQPYCIVRLVAWTASHDIGKGKTDNREKISLVEKLAGYLRVFISAEGTLPLELEKYRLEIDPNEMHNLLAYATIYLGEGATMAAECGVLGTPAIYFNRIVRYYNEDLEKFGLVYNFRSIEGVYEKVIKILNTPGRRRVYHDRRMKMLEQRICTSTYLVGFIEKFASDNRIR